MFRAGVVVCPLCKKPTHTTDPSSLPTNYPLLEIIEDSSAPSSQKVVKCEHQDKETNILCKTCSLILCLDCMLSPAHEGHKFAKVAAEAERIKEQMRKEVETGADTISTLRSSATSVRDAAVTLQERQEKFKAEARASVLAPLQEALVRLEQSIVAHVDAVCRDRIDQLARQQVQLWTATQRMEETFYRCTELLTQPDPVALVLSGPDMLRRHASASAGGPPLKPCCGLDLRLVDHEALARALAAISRVVVFADPPAVEPRDYAALCLPRSVASFGTGPGMVKDPAGMCEGTGGSIVVCDSHNRRVFELFLDGRPQQTVVQYESGGRRPVAVACLPSGDYVLSDVTNQQVCRLGRDGNVRWATGGRGSERSQFRFPWDLKVLVDGRVIVSDRDNNRLQILDPINGVVIGSLTPLHTGQVLESPRGIAVDREGMVYVVDAARSRVLVIHADGRVARAYGGVRGSGEGQLDEPCGVAVDAVGNVLVADYNNHRIAVFRPDGSTTHFAVPRVQPVRVLVDAAGRVLIGGSRDDDGTTTDAQVFLF